MKRKEDPRFIRGRGRYLDDIILPKMLYLALVHSPYPHARIKSIDKSKAMALPGVKAVITGEDLDAAKLEWLPTFHGYDKQMVLAFGKALYQYQEVAGVVATSRELRTTRRSWSTLSTSRSIRSSIRSKQKKIRLSCATTARTRRITSITGRSATRPQTATALDSSAVRIKERIFSPRCHPAPLEPCGIVADMNKATGRLTLYMTSQAPHVHRTAFSLVTGIPEDKIHVISPDVGGGFGNKVPVYPGYVVATVASVIIGVPVKWVETRTENLTTTGFARDYHMDVEIGATKEGKVTALKVSTVADHGAFDAAADPRKYPAGMFGIVTGSYDFPAAFAEVDAYFTNKPPGGIAYRCSFRVTEASFAIERGMDILARKLEMDPVDLRRQNFVKKEQFPYSSPLGFMYDSGDYDATMRKALDIIGYEALRKEQAEKRKRAS